MLKRLIFLLAALAASAVFVAACDCDCPPQATPSIELTQNPQSDQVFDVQVAEDAAFRLITLYGQLELPLHLPSQLNLARAEIAAERITAICTDPDLPELLEPSCERLDKAIESESPNSDLLKAAHDELRDVSATNGFDTFLGTRRWDVDLIHYQVPLPLLSALYAARLWMFEHTQALGSVADRPIRPCSAGEPSPNQSTTR